MPTSLRQQILKFFHLKVCLIQICEFVHKIYDVVQGTEFFHVGTVEDEEFVFKSVENLLDDYWVSFRIVLACFYL